jgi:VCBS repeat protein
MEAVLKPPIRMHPVPCAFLLTLLVPQASVPAHVLRPQQARSAVDVPLSLLPGASDLGFTTGVSFLDFDADGWIDLYVNLTGELRRNVDGIAFPIVADLDVFLPGLPPFPIRYGSACADYDEDGLPDIAGEPRGRICLYLLKNMDGAGSFLDVAQDPAVLPEPLPCAMQAETFCWADTDDDGDLDLFAPAYPDDVAPKSGGNHFYESLGATGPAGAHRFALSTAASGLENPPGVARPEGAQFADADRDGDLDLYSNGTLYQNVSSADGPRFLPLVGDPTGITFPELLDEGACFFDYDLDGDPDLLVLHANVSCHLYESRGDGTFVDASAALERPTLDTSAGCSAADWDLDGDIDLTTASTFRRNGLVETGEPFLRVASHGMGPLASPSPAWGDWDKDGDLDCALANWAVIEAALYQNTTYGPSTPELEKLSLRVRPMKDSSLLPRGLETEFGTTVELRLHGDAPGRTRRQFTASSHGYLQQSEYALTFGLPPGPDPSAPARGVVFDLAVDFPSRSDRGLLRIDPSVNAALGGIDLALLKEREISVFRSGLVRIDGVDFSPAGSFAARLGSTGPLVLPDAGGPPPGLVPAPAPSWFVGLELDTRGASGPTRLEELVLDGALASAASARCGANVVLWDVTPGEMPRAVHRLRLATSPRNARSFLPLSLFLKPQRVYRFLCRVESLRSSPFVAPTDPVTNRGGISFANPDPCDGAAVLAAPVDAERAFLELRYRLAVPGALGQSLRR